MQLWSTNEIIFDILQGFRVLTRFNMHSSSDGLFLRELDEKCLRSHGLFETLLKSVLKLESHCSLGETIEILFICDFSFTICCSVSLCLPLSVFWYLTEAPGPAGPLPALQSQCWFVALKWSHCVDSHTGGKTAYSLHRVFEKAF